MPIVIKEDEHKENMKILEAKAKRLDQIIDHYKENKDKSLDEGSVKLLRNLEDTKAQLNQSIRSLGTTFGFISNDIDSYKRIARGKLEKPEIYEQNKVDLDEKMTDLSDNLQEQSNYYRGQLQKCNQFADTAQNLLKDFREQKTAVGKRNKNDSLEIQNENTPPNKPGRP